MIVFIVCNLGISHLAISWDMLGYSLLVGHVLSWKIILVVSQWWLHLPRMSHFFGACCGWTLIWHVGHWTDQIPTDIHFLPVFLNIQRPENVETQLSKSRDRWWCLSTQNSSWSQLTWLGVPPAPTSEACGREACPALYSAVPFFARHIRDIYFGVILTGTGTDFGIPGMPSDEKR